MTDEDYRTIRRREWDEAGKRYNNLSAGPLADLMRQANAQIFKYAALSSGQNVLDVGTGPGSPALEAVAFVGSSGKVTGIDSAPSMIEAARRRAKEAGVENAAFFEMEAENLTFPDNSFDAIISRYGYPHFTNAVQALKESHRVLRPRGRIAAALHGAVERNPYFTAPVLALKKFHLNPTAITDRGPFFFHAPDLLESAMRQAGFDDAKAYAHDGEIIIEDFAKYWDAQKAGGAAVRRALDAVPPERRAEGEQAALAAMSKYVSNNRGVFPAQIVIGVGTKGARA
jgi:SAM-dependent methyltransferase